MKIDKDLGFEDALSRLETLVNIMEDDNTTLESSLVFYREGVALSRHCEEILSRFESEIIILQKEDCDKNAAGDRP